MNKIYLFICCAFLSLSASANSINEGIAEDINQLLGEWELVPGQPTIDTWSSEAEARGETYCSPLNKGETGLFRVRFYEEPETNEFTTAGNPTVVIEEYWGESAHSPWLMAFDRVRFGDINLGPSIYFPPMYEVGSFVLPGILTHETWTEDGGNIIRHRVWPGALQTLQFDEATGKLVYTYAPDYAGRVTEKCEFVRKNQ